MNCADLPPYGEALGIDLASDESGMPVLYFDFTERVLGRPGFVHGGALSGLMEMAAVAALKAELSTREGEYRLKPVNIAVEFMRGGTERRTYAMGRVTRAGRRVAIVVAEAWQDDRARPVATAQMKVLLSPAG